MVLSLALLPFLLPAACASGWIMGAKNAIKSGDKPTPFFTREYYVGLNYLLNEQPDKAVDVFIKLLEVDSNTVEMHLALGSLFRRRGEVDRAIRIHQNLIERPQLSQQQRVEALLALGRDYMSAGVLDRAEHVFLEVVRFDSDNTAIALRYLVDIYEQERAWENAISTVKTLESVTDESYHQMIAHYHCELADAALKHNDTAQARLYIKQALSADHQCVRASLLLAGIEEKEGNIATAVKIYRRVKQQDPDFVSEAIKPLAACYEKLGDEEGLISFLQDTMHQYPRITVLLILAEKMRAHYGVDLSADYFAEQLQTHPSIRGVNKLIQWHIDTTDGKVQKKLQVLLALTQKLMDLRPIYRCSSCGFGGKALHWLCPSCRQWNTVKPIHGIEGD